MYKLSLRKAPPSPHPRLGGRRQGGVFSEATVNHSLKRRIKYYKTLRHTHTRHTHEKRLQKMLRNFEITFVRRQRANIVVHFQWTGGAGDDWGGGELIIVQNINLPMRVDNPAYIFYTRKTIRGGDCPNSFRVQIQNHHKNKITSKKTTTPGTAAILKKATYN